MTPFGGVAFIAAWLWLAVELIRRQRTGSERNIISEVPGIRCANQMELVKLERQRAVDAVYAALREGILNSLFQPGERLHVDALSIKLGVSLTPVRNAIQQLASEGLVRFGHAAEPLSRTCRYGTWRRPSRFAALWKLWRRRTRRG